MNTPNVRVLEEGACPNCGNDVFSSVDIDGLFSDGDEAFCRNCGKIGQVTCDNSHAYFSEVE